MQANFSWRIEKHADDFPASRAERRPESPASAAQSGGDRGSGSRLVDDVSDECGERLSIVGAWEVMPDLVTANQGEPGIVELCELLLSRAVGIEAGLLSADDARAFVRSGLAHRCRRVLIEPLDADPETAVQHAAMMEDIVMSAGITLDQVHHGYGMACWAVNQRGLDRGHGIRTGLEDVTVLPDGSQAADNAALVAAAVRLIRANLQQSNI